MLAFQLGLLHRDAVLSVAGSHELRLRYRPMRRVGVMVPGGAAAYPSTLLMTIVPAQAAGVREIAVCLPPTPHGAYNLDLLAVCHELGVTEVYRIGGAQAVAALAYGVEGLRAVDMIVGPGNIFVALAKRHVFGQVAIDCVAGPSEIVVLADDTARADFVAADLIAQAEHSPGASLLITWHEPLLDAVSEALAGSSRRLCARRAGRGKPAELRRPGAGSRCRRGGGLRQRASHRSTCTSTPATPRRWPSGPLNAGAIFLGPYTPVAVGDYVAGPSHVLPTGGTARFSQRPVGQRFPQALQRALLHAGRPGEGGRRRAPAWPTRKD